MTGQKDTAVGAATDSTFSHVDEDEARHRPDSGASTPGLLLIHAAQKPAMEILPLQGASLEIGRGHAAFAGREDPKMSRQHARITYCEGRFEVTDLGSRNGSALDGMPLVGSVRCDAQRVLRLGQSLFLLCHDIAPYRSLGVKVQDGRVEGPLLQQALQAVARLAEHGPTLFIHGESGAGKESLAQTFHRAGPQRRGPFVAVNCATIPEGLAERLLFGAQKGAYSGAGSDSEGYIQAAHGGTLFLDEVADLDATVQAKLLRTLESREVTPLGATRSKRVEVRVCSATHKNLRELASAGTFRADLYFRLGMPQVAVPPLRQRIEEIPWLVAQATAKVAPELRIATQLVETCMLRHWPGNVRELFAEIHAAAVHALGAGASVLTTEHLSASAGTALSAPSAALESPRPAALDEPPKAIRPPPPKEEVVEPRRPPPSRTQIMVALLETRGNLTAAAHALGLHRTQLRRYLHEYEIDLDRIRDLDKS